MSWLFSFFGKKRKMNNAVVVDPDNGASNLDTVEVGSPSGGNNSVEEVFSNHLIWKQLGSYLNMVDLLNCRQVNSGFHAMVMRETNFLDRCLVSLKPNQITRNIFGSTSEPWRNVELVFGNPGGEGSTSNFRFDEDEMEWLYPIVSNVESLKLRMKLGTKGGDFYPILKRLLKAPNKLRALAIEPRFLRERAKDLLLEDWTDTFEGLEEFEVLKPPSGWQNDFEDWKTYSGWEDCDLLCAFSFSMKNIRVLKHYPVNFLAADEVFAFESVLLTVWLSRIASDNTCTLKHFMFPCKAIFDDERPEEGFLSFPLLESATFYLMGSMFPHIEIPSERFREYLLALPMLKKLDLTVCDISPGPILNTIWERSDQMRILKIRSPNFEGTNWQFLKNTKIDGLELVLLNSGQPATLPDEALNCLPSTIKRLCLMGRLASNPIPALARLNQSVVTELTFIESGDCFSDDTIQYILANFKMLRVLVVKNVQRVSDAGFVASSESRTLSGIKGLKFLSLSGCGSITDATLREIRFLELSNLDVLNNEGVTEEGWKQMLRNNPSLLAELKRRKGEHVKESS